MAPIIRAGVLAGALFGTTILAGAPAAAATLSVTPALGAPSAVFGAQPFDPSADTAQWGCRWNCGWGRGWGGRRGWRRNRVDGGDVLIGAAIIGGAIAIANSNRRRERERDVVVIDRDPRYRDRDPAWDRRDERRDDRRTGSAGLDNAVDMCLDRIERDVRVDRVDEVQRGASGWDVSGTLFNGASFTCRIGNGGQIEGIDYGEGFTAMGDAPRADGQWDDQSYAQLRAGLGVTVRPDLAVQEAGTGQPARAPARGAGVAAMPAYPGGPIPGEVIPETIEDASGG